MVHNIYIFCLSIGVIYSIFSLVFHFFSAAFDFGFDFDVSVETNLDIFLPIKPFTVMVFFTVFGGAGLISEKSLHVIPSIIASFIIAYMVALILYRVVYITLLKYQSVTKEASAAIGIAATILESVPHNGFGRISYVVDGNILSGVAKRYFSDKGEDYVVTDNNSREVLKIDVHYKKGKQVYIWDFKDNVYYVSLEPFIKDSSELKQ